MKKVITIVVLLILLAFVTVGGIWTDFKSRSYPLLVKLDFPALIDVSESIKKEYDSVDWVYINSSPREYTIYVSYDDITKEEVIEIVSLYDQAQKDKFEEGDPHRSLRVRFADEFLAMNDDEYISYLYYPGIYSGTVYEDTLILRRNYTWYGTSTLTEDLPDK